jgi:P22 coat protein - gene protein 5
MANMNILVERLAKTILPMTRNRLVAVQAANRDYENEIVNPGDTINVRRPTKYKVRTVETASPRDSIRGKLPLKVDKIAGVDLQYFGKEMSLEVPDMVRNFDLKSAAAAIAQQVDSDLLLEAKNSAHNWVGVPGNAIDSFLDFSLAPQRMEESLFDPAEAMMVLSTQDKWSMLSSNAAIAGASQPVTDALVKAKLDIYANVKTGSTSAPAYHTNGAWAGAPAVNGAGQVYAYSAVKDDNAGALITGGWTGAGAVAVGDIFTIASVFDINPDTKVSYGRLKQFRVTAAGVNAAGALTLAYKPAIISDTNDPQQNVSAAPANDAALTFLGTASTTYRQNLLIHPSALTIAFRPMAKIGVAAEYVATDDAYGLALKVSSDGDIINNKMIIRADVLYGLKGVRPDGIIRANGA